VIDHNKVLTNFEVGVVLNFLLHTMKHEQRFALRDAFPVQYAKLYPTTEEK